jgi:methionine-rich copper-binding protein CopC
VLRKCLVVSFFAWLSVTGAAQAHAHLVSSVPADVAKAPPSTLRLTFSEGVEPRLSGVTVTGPANTTVPTGTPSLAKDDDKVLIVPIAQAPGAGTYTVTWHALSKDGHVTHGSYVFKVSP